MPACNKGWAWSLVISYISYINYAEVLDEKRATCVINHFARESPKKKKEKGRCFSFERPGLLKMEASGNRIEKKSSAGGMNVTNLHMKLWLLLVTRGRRDSSGRDISEARKLNHGATLQIRLLLYTQPQTQTVMYKDKATNSGGNSSSKRWKQKHGKGRLDGRVGRSLTVLSLPFRRSLIFATTTPSIHSFIHPSIICPHPMLMHQF